MYKIYISIGNFLTIINIVLNKTLYSYLKYFFLKNCLVLYTNSKISGLPLNLKSFKKKDLCSEIELIDRL